MRLVTTSEYLSLERTPITWLIEGLLPVESFSLLIGEPKAGKSFFALQLANALASGDPFLGRASKPDSQVLYVNLDAADSSWHNRIVFMQSQGVVFSNRLHFVHPEDDLRPCNIMSDTVQRAFRSAIEKLQPDLVVIDVVREMHSQKEESSTDMKVVVEKVLGVTGKSAVLAIHHTVKISNKEEIRVIDLARGSSYLTGKAETLLCLMDNRFYTVPRFADQQILHGTRNHGLWVLPDL